MYYLFSPLLDEEGKQVVRKPKPYEYFIRNGFVGCSYGIYDERQPILTMQKFEEDPFEEIRVFLYKHKYEWSASREEMWNIINALMERLEGK